MEKYENRKIDLIGSGSLPSQRIQKNFLLAKYQSGFRIFVKIIRVKIDKNNKKKKGREKKRSLSSFIQLAAP